MICKFIQSCRSVWCRHKLLWFLRSRYLPCGKLSYFIYTKIYTVKLHHSCLWLDQQCIFMGSSLFPIFELKCEKISASMYGIKTLYHGKCLNDFYSLVVIQQKNSLICHAHFFFFFLCFPTRELKLFRAHFLWNNLSLSASEINKEEAMPPAVVLFLHLYLLQQRTNGW